MGIDAISATLRLPGHVGPTSRLVLVALADYADDAGFAYPSHTTLSERTELSKTHVRRIFHALLQPDGHPPWLTCEVNGAPDKRIPLHRRPNLYRLLYLEHCTCGEALQLKTKWVNLDAHRDKPDSDEADEVGARGEPNGCPSDADGCAPARTKSSLEEPSKELPRLVVNSYIPDTVEGPVPDPAARLRAIRDAMHRGEPPTADT